ncbi:hypothetical protein ETH_00021880 [Eimeria tenella]|uniref:RecF/RecN/SMC N-terminal domain-containing protein n=1 Tax=Eimeria tenella TaxID=5802 RepID=U6KM45_EIMTE|nr:hypothetical protein ETH_00021880 [Eimeria tenella]CDJ37871.1 hypothetical protein ETH_00021880 [Eimeria tenella]|eukprot:XP_013228709.1 hypothetical protein ETH_00021880 [Eimeria tenella]
MCESLRVISSSSSRRRRSSSGSSSSKVSLRLLRLAAVSLCLLFAASQSVAAELAESSRLLQQQQQKLLAPKAAVALAEENYKVRTGKLLQALQLSAKQTREDFRRLAEAALPHRCSLAFDHQQQQLRMQTLDRNQQQVSSSPTALSGGEKSCLQVAFLAALAARSCSPLHLFDEVDVFMDERNRIKK